MTQQHGKTNGDTFSKLANKHVLPLPPQADAQHKDEMAIYARFMRHLRYVPNSRVEIKILSAIQFTADMLQLSDAHVSKTLVEQGLRAPRLSFPADFLSFMDQACMRSDWEVGGPNQAMKELKEFWDYIGEDKFASVKGGHDLLEAHLASAV
ncbi:MAG: hypothetical protein ACLFR0_04560 [Alphaproteobacteria bacterium]